MLVCHNRLATVLMQVWCCIMNLPKSVSCLEQNWEKYNLITKIVHNQILVISWPSNWQPCYFYVSMCITCPCREIFKRPTVHLKAGLLQTTNISYFGDKIISQLQWASKMYLLQIQIFTACVISNVISTC